MAGRYGSDHQLVKDTKGLKDHLTRGFTRRALDIFCQEGSPKDLALVRDALNGDFVGYSNLDVDYLRRHGEWQDIPLIIAAVGRGEYGVSISANSHVKYENAARAIYAMAKDRLSELLDLPMPNLLLVRLILEASDSTFRALSDSQLQKFLHFEDDSVRKACALRSVKTLPKRRVCSLLNGYLSGNELRYYNVIHWLDLGASAPKDIAQRTATNALRESWNPRRIKRFR